MPEFPVLFYCCPFIRFAEISSEREILQIAIRCFYINTSYVFYIISSIWSNTGSGVDQISQEQTCQSMMSITTGDVNRDKIRLWIRYVEEKKMIFLKNESAIKNACQSKMLVMTKTFKRQTI